MIKYLKNTSTGSSVDSSLIISTLTSTLFANAVTISNTTPSIDNVTGALVVAGGIGTSGNINASGNITTLGNIKALNGEFVSNLIVQGYTTSNYVTVPGILKVNSGDFNYIYGNNLTISGQTITSNLEVINNGNFGSITSNVAVIKSITTDKASAVNLYVDNIYPNTGTQINLGSIGNVRIVGGGQNQVIGTDGNGNLSWVSGTNSITVGTGLRRDGDVISLSGTGFVAGTFNQVTIDQYGRVVSATNFVNDLQDVTTRSATTNNAISITNETESVDLASGAFTVAGGVGIGGTLNTQSLAVTSNAAIGESLSVSGQINVTGTVNFNSTQVPLKISSGTLVSNPTVGSLEFDGTSLYITTNVGRQLVQVKNSQLSAAVTFVARAVAARNINIANGTQYTSGGDDNWDDVILELKDVVLLTNQTNPTENGLYIWNTENSPLTRHPDFNTLSTIRQGTIIFVSEGIFNGGSFYKVTNPDPITVGTTQLLIKEHFNADNIALSSLPKNTNNGLLVRTKYGSIALRGFQSNISWITVSNATGLDGNITLNATTIPVSAGGTGRSTITGWMKGVGGSIQTLPMVPLADVLGAGTMASQNANAVSIIGGSIDSTLIGKSTAASANFTEISVGSSSYSAFFNNTNDYLAINNPPASVRAWDINAFTIEMWIYVTSFSAEATLIGNLVPNTNNWFWGFNLKTNGALKFVYRNTAGNSTFWDTGPVITANQWYHVAFIKETITTSPFVTLSMYVNGVRRSSIGDPDGNNTGMSSASYPLAFGVNYNGYITNLRISSGIALYTGATFTAPTSSLGLLPTTTLLTCQTADFVDKSTNALTITANGSVESSTLSPFDSLMPYSNLVLNDYLTGLLRVMGDSSLNGLLQVAGTIYKNGYEVLSDNDVIDGGTY